MCPVLAHLPYPSETIGALLIALFDTPVFLALLVLALIPAVRARRWHAIAAFLLAIGAAYIATYGLKQLFLVPRLSDAWLVLTDPRFPSGHVTAVTALVVATIMLYWKTIKTRPLPFFALGALLIISVGLARMMVRAHCVVDVAAGVLAGGIVAAGVFAFSMGTLWHTQHRAQ